MAKKTIVVHDGLFHCDELVAIALWLLAHPGEVFEVIRSRDPEVVINADIAIDVGGVYDPEVSRFDHHMKEVPVHAGTPIRYAACGMVWDHIKDDISHLYFGGLNVTPFYEFQDRVLAQLILGVDACDNGQANSNNNEIHQFTLSELVKTMNCSNIKSMEQEQVFNQLVEIVKCWTDKFLKNTAQAVRDKYTVLEAANASKDGVLVLPTFCPVWKEVVLEENLPIKLCLVDAGHGEWSITSALKEAGSMAPLCPAPEALRGTMAGDGKFLGGCPIVFVHKAGFTGKIKANNLEAAVEACKAWING